MICVVPIGQNAVIRLLLLISVCIFACVMSSEYTGKFVMKFLPAQFSCQFEKCLNINCSQKFTDHMNAD